jgi:hypothetical protein
MQDTLIHHIQKFAQLESHEIDVLESCLGLSQIKKKRTCSTRRTNMQYNVFCCKRLYASIHN